MVKNVDDSLIIEEWITFLLAPGISNDNNAIRNKKL